MQWLDELCEEISEKLADTKRVRFNTHKNRKLFTGELIKLIKDTVVANVPQPSQQEKVTRATITHPNPRESKGYAVMTSGDSAKADDLAKLSNERKGIRTW